MTVPSETAYPARDPSLPNTGEFSVVDDGPGDSRTGAAGRPSFWLRHDLVVVAIAAVLLIAGALSHRRLTAPTMTRFVHRGLAFERPARLLGPPTDVAVPPSVLTGLSGVVGEGDRGPAAPERFHKTFPYGPLMRLEVLIDRRPAYKGLATWLKLARQTRYGDYLWFASAAVRTINGREWHRVEFVYAVEATAGDAPQIATGVEYATVNEDSIYVVTMHGTAGEAAWLESQILGTLSVVAVE
jgi:hypothetical protein